MAIRTYGQHCGLAAAMDLVGQRWAMLVVRELAPGPRRFTDIHGALPGVATDVLAQRLRELMAAGVVEHRVQRHPTPVKLYSLTESGLTVADIAARLGDWGRSLLPASPPAGAAVRARWALQTMVHGYRGGADDGDYQFVVDDEELTVRVDGGAASVHYGPSGGQPSVRMVCSRKQFFTAVSDPSWLAQPHRGVEIDGDAEVLQRLLTALPLEFGRVAAQPRADLAARAR